MRQLAMVARGGTGMASSPGDKGPGVQRATPLTYGAKHLRQRGSRQSLGRIITAGAPDSGGVIGCHGRDL